MNNRQNINPQEATFNGESQNINQQQKKSQPTEIEINHKDVSEEKKNDSTDELTKEDKFVEEAKSYPDDNREVESPKRDFGVDSSVIKMNEYKRCIKEV